MQRAAQRLHGPVPRCSRRRHLHHAGAQPRHAPPAQPERDEGQGHDAEPAHRAQVGKTLRQEQRRVPPPEGTEQHRRQEEPGKGESADEGDRGEGEDLGEGEREAAEEDRAADGGVERAQEPLLERGSVTGARPQGDQQTFGHLPVAATTAAAAHVRACCAFSLPDLTFFSPGPKTDRG